LKGSGGIEVTKRRAEILRVFAIAVAAGSYDQFDREGKLLTATTTCVASFHHVLCAWVEVDQVLAEPALGFISEYAW
jgi:hypothetical protein